MVELCKLIIIFLGSPMKDKFNLCMLLLLGATATHGLGAMEAQEAQVKTHSFSKFLYKHPWVSSLAVHAGALAIAWRFKRFQNFVEKTIDEMDAPTLWLPLCAAIPTGATIAKRYGHHTLLSSHTPHHMKTFHSICSSDCKGQYQDLIEKNAALEKIAQQKQQLDAQIHVQIQQLNGQANQVVRDYNSKKFSY